MTILTEVCHIFILSTLIVSKEAYCHFVLVSDVEFTRGINLSLCQVDTEQYRKCHREQDVRQWQSPVPVHS